MTKKNFLSCVCCGKSVTSSTSQVHRTSKTSTLIQRYCFKCLDTVVLKSSNWRMPYSDSDTHIMLGD